MQSNTGVMFQVASLQSLMQGYTRPVISVGELLQHGDTGLGTFENVNGEMITIDGHCFQADAKGNASEISLDAGVPFSSLSFLHPCREFEAGSFDDIEQLKTFLDVKIEEDFGLNSMHVVRIDGHFPKICARSESGLRAQHVTLKEILADNQTEFFFDDINGSLVCIYYPDYMDGINASGWHLHFISDDRKFGGHVFDLSMTKGKVYLKKINQIHIQFPTDAAFDTYSLKAVSNEDVKQVEQEG